MKIAARKKVNVIHIRISAEQGNEFRVDEPCDLGAGIRFAKQCDRRKRIDDVTERTWLDN